MFNPLYLFTTDVLDATIKRGCTFFVRNNYPNAFNPLETNNKGNYLITPYDDLSKALAHFNSIPTDKARFLCKLEDAEQKAKLEIASAQPEGYKIYSPYFYTNYKDKITPRLKEKINNYMYQHTRWRPGKSDVVHIDFFLLFGTLYISMSFAGITIKIMFAGGVGNLSHKGLKLELQAIKYKIFSDKKVRVVSKDAMKKILGKSADYADSIVHTNWVKTYRGVYNGWPIFGSS